MAHTSNGRETDSAWLANTMFLFLRKSSALGSGITGYYPGNCFIMEVEEFRQTAGATSKEGEGARNRSPKTGLGVTLVTEVGSIVSLSGWW